MAQLPAPGGRPSGDRPGEPRWLDDDGFEPFPDVLAVPFSAPEVDPRHFRDVLGRFASGVTVVTSVSGGVPVGLTCQSFTSVSLDPPLVLFCPSRTSRAWPLIQRSGAFCVNILAADQQDVSEVMASRGIDKFAEVGWSPSRETGSPVLDGSLAHVDCTVEQVHEAGDHFVVVGRVHHLVADRDAAPLVFHRGGYGAGSGQSNV